MRELNIKFATRHAGEMYARNTDGTNIAAFDVSSYAQAPFNSLSPFTYSKDFEIPVPGMEGAVAHSVESIWQGLKIISGRADVSLFGKKPVKRKGHVEGHSFGNEVLGLREAREKIYVPPYTHYLNNYASQEAISAILAEQRKGKKVHVYDVEDNGDITDPRPLAHAFVLATYLNLKIHNQEFTPINDAERTLFGVLDGEETLEEKAAVIEPLLIDPEINRAFQFRCVQHPRSPDDFHIAEALGFGVEE